MKVVTMASNWLLPVTLAFRGMTNTSNWLLPVTTALRGVRIASHWPCTGDYDLEGSDDTQ